MTSGIGGPASFVYGGSWLRAILLALLLSWGMMNIIARLVEHRSMLTPYGQYKSFWFGDLICLPGIVLAIWYLGRHMHESSNLTRSWGWNILCLAAGLTSGIVLHLMDADSSKYSESMMRSPTKLYHDFVVMTLFVYIIFVAGLPAMYHTWHMVWPYVVIAVFAATFFWLLSYDGKHVPTKAHVDYLWPWQDSS